MADAIWMLLSLSLSGTVLALLAALLYRLLHRVVPGALFYALWGLVLLRMVCPMGLSQGVSYQAVVQLEEMTASALEQTPAQTQDLVWTTRPVQATRAPLSPGAWLTMLWGAGAAAVLLWRLWSYRAFSRALLRRAKPAPAAAWELLHAMTGPGGSAPRLLQCDDRSAPLLMGLLRPCILLPTGEFSQRQMEGMLAHELTHHRRFDLAVKWVATAIVAVHWFNPAAWWALRQLDLCCELSCDEHVVKAWPACRRADYGELLLLLSHPCRQTAIISASFGTEKKRLKERLVSIMTPKIVRKKTLLLMAAALLVMAASSVAMGAYAGQEQDALTDPQDALYTQVSSTTDPGKQTILTFEQPFEAQEQQVRITASYGSRVHPLTAEEIRHDGVDFGLASGTPVLAAAQGVVESAGYDGAKGNAVVLRHGEILTHYYHLSEINVEQGQPVEVGDQIGKVGSTGNSTGPHLHFAVQQDGAFEDPIELLEHSEG